MSLGAATAGRPDAFRARVASNLQLEEAAVVVTSALRHPQFAAIEWIVDAPTGELSEPIPPEDAYLLAVHLGAAREKHYWEAGRQVGRFVRVAGQSAISDLRRQPQLLFDTPVHALLVYLPRAAMNALAEASGQPPVEDLRFEPGAGFRDDTFWGLAQALLPALRAPEQVSRLFTDNVALALASHAASYADRDLARPFRGGLAPWQEKRAKEMMLADVGDISLGDLAAACGISASHFARSFRKCTGLTPHAWLLRVRVQQAMVRLRRDDETVASAAAACGFADPSHFARVFIRHVGLSPSAWRRLAMR
ncbi:MAG: AraC family transcriptional regulator [Phenylobacterium sp.]|nr:MAG: AraC family transcriptional regulator [Phenylobacterium sp.]